MDDPFEVGTEISAGVIVTLNAGLEGDKEWRVVWSSSGKYFLLWCEKCIRIVNSADMGVIVEIIPEDRTLGLAWIGDDGIYYGDGCMLKQYSLGAGSLRLSVELPGAPVCIEASAARGDVIVSVVFTEKQADRAPGGALLRLPINLSEYIYLSQHIYWSKFALVNDGTEIVASSMLNDDRLLVCKINEETIGEVYSGDVHYVTTFDLMEVSTRRNLAAMESRVRDRAINSIAIWDVRTRQMRRVLEGHTSALKGYSFSRDDVWMVSWSEDGEWQIWNTVDWLPVMSGPVPHGIRSIAFSPVRNNILIVTHFSINICSYNSQVLESQIQFSSYSTYHSAKVVIMGESNVGKSCLAMRLAEQRYPEVHEHGTTHGMRFWVMAVAGGADVNQFLPAESRELILWDFGGQSEYQLVHQIFLEKTTVAMIVVEPCRGERSLGEARRWYKKIERQLRSGAAIVLLVGSQVDDAINEELIDKAAFRAVCADLNIKEFICVSALTNRNLEELRNVLVDAVDWDALTKVSRSELFQRIREEIFARKRMKRVVVMLEDLCDELHNPDSSVGALLMHQISMALSSDAGEEAIRTVCEQLYVQGVLVETALSDGKTALILDLPTLERYASSVVLLARENPMGVPAVELSQLGVSSIRLPGLDYLSRLPRPQELIVLEAAVELMVKHGICFRHEGLLVFPTLMRTEALGSEKALPGNVSLYFDFSGPIDNVYASLIAWLVIGGYFGKVKMWEDRFEFDDMQEGVCGVRRVGKSSGLAHLDVYFGAGVTAARQDLFVEFVHRHLLKCGIDIVEHVELTCVNAICRYEFPRDVIQARISRGDTDVACPKCDTRVGLKDGIYKSKRDEKIEKEAFALMTRVKDELPRVIEGVKAAGFRRESGENVKLRPIRVLHLSDLHFGDMTNVAGEVWALCNDIKNGSFMSSSEIDYVVVSGDFTHKGGVAGFEKAYEFLDNLVESLSLSANRFVLVPGNHDLQELDDIYDWKLNKQGAAGRDVVQQGNLIGVPNERYGSRFKAFSDKFYHPFLQKPFELNSEQQGVVHTFASDCIQFLGFNSSWEIDQFHRDRASINQKSLFGVLLKADQEIEDANSDVNKFIRIAVWHHPVVHHSRAIKNPECLELLINGQVSIGLTGDIHEMARETVRHWHSSNFPIIGAGSFGADSNDLGEGSPRLYNVLEIERSHKKIRVHTRQRPKARGAWRGWNEWEREDGQAGGVPYFDLMLSDKK